MINGVKCKDLGSIEKKLSRFILNCTHLIIHSEMQMFFTDKIRNAIPCIENSFKDSCKTEINIEELDTAIQKMASDKSPGTNALMANFYKFF